MTARKGNAPETKDAPATDEVPETPKKSFNLCCTYCGSKLNVTLRYESSGYYGENVFEAIECSDTRCGAEWDDEGILMQEPLSVRYPDLYGDDS